LAVDIEKGIYFFASLVVPMINLYILKEVIFFRRSLFILAMSAISAFLYFKLFPKKFLISAPVDKSVEKKR